jgi:hypothetical protein
MNLTGKDAAPHPRCIFTSWFGLGGEESGLDSCPYYSLRPKNQGHPDDSSDVFLKKNPLHGAPERAC